MSLWCVVCSWYRRKQTECGCESSSLFCVEDWKKVKCLHFYFKMGCLSWSELQPTCKRALELQINCNIYVNFLTKAKSWKVLLTFRVQRIEFRLTIWEFSMYFKSITKLLKLAIQFWSTYRFFPVESCNIQYYALEFLKDSSVFQQLTKNVICFNFQTTRLRMFLQFEISQTISRKCFK